VKKPQYDEGPKAKEKFERTTTALVRVPKSVGAGKIKKKAKKGKAWALFAGRVPA
jgi:hypothetical protein